jgi:hypothetical protein
MEMMPRLGDKYDIEIEIISKPRAEYTTAEYLESGWPKAPAIMVGDEIVVQGADISEDKLETVICRYLNLPPPELKKGIINRLLNK